MSGPTGPKSYGGATNVGGTPKGHYCALGSAILTGHADAAVALCSEGLNGLAKLIQKAEGSLSSVEKEKAALEKQIRDNHYPQLAENAKIRLGQLEEECAAANTRVITLRKLFNAGESEGERSSSLPGNTA